jgi:hypothetical protein
MLESFKECLKKEMLGQKSLREKGTQLSSGT